MDLLIFQHTIKVVITMTNKIIFQKRFLDKELPDTGYCEEHGLFTNAAPNQISMAAIKEVLNDHKDTTGDFLVALICPNCRTEGILRICKQSV